METEKRIDSNLESEKAYYTGKLTNIDGSQGGCVDERNLVTGKPRLGPKTLGGSVEFADMMFIAMHWAGINTEYPDMSVDGKPFDVVALIMGLYDTERAKSLKIKPGVHNDDDHGEITDPTQLAKRDEGCGHDRVRPGVLLREFGVKLSKHDSNLVGRFVAAGVPIETYTGNHIRGAKAVENYSEGTTLDTVAVLEEERPAFDHDIWVLVGMADEMANSLRKLGGRYVMAAAKLTPENVADWASRLYRGTLTDLDGPAGSVIEIGKKTAST